MFSGVEEQADLAGLQIEPGQVWTLMKITGRASQCQILDRIVTVMLLGADVIDDERQN